jgi:hypothetical protein
MMGALVFRYRRIASTESLNVLPTGVLGWNCCLLAAISGSASWIDLELHSKLPPPPLLFFCLPLLVVTDAGVEDFGRPGWVEVQQVQQVWCSKHDAEHDATEQVTTGQVQPETGHNRSKRNNK